MSYYAFSADLIQRLTRVFWGAKIPQPDGSKIDTGVEEYNSELLAALQSQDPIKLQSSIDLIAPQNGPAIRIWGDGNGGIQFIDGSTVTTVVVGPPSDSGNTASGASGAATFMTSVDVSVSLAGVSIDTSGLSISINVSGCTVTATLTGTATLVGSPTVTVTPHTGSANFTDGAYQGGP